MLNIKKFKKSAQNYCNELIKKRSNNVPADFSNNQREYTKKKRISYLYIIQLINEPTAVVLAYIYYYKEYFNKEKKSF